MSDDSKEQPSGPAWQRASSSASPSTPNTPATSESTSSLPETPDADMPPLERASKFLEDVSVRDAPRPKKVAFLESKGISVEDIEKLLPAESPAASSILSKFDSTQAPRDVAPVVTYPEFLTRRAKPAPLVTISGILTTAYTAAAAAAGVYGLSRYVIEPMAASLTDARHEFATHALTHLDELSKKLEGVVSKVPPATPSYDHETEKASRAMGHAESESEDDDPTELFHRDCATQTSPSLSRRESGVSVGSALPTGAEIERSSADAHADTVRSLETHITQLLEAQRNSVTASDAASSQVKDLTSYLQDMAYQSPYYNGYLGAGSYGGATGNKSPGWKNDDAAETLRADIRSVKGMLLSARNFPAASKAVPGKFGVNQA